MEYSTITSKGQILIPVKLRKKYHLLSGNKVCFEETETGVTIKAIDESFIGKFKGFLEKTGTLKNDISENRKSELVVENDKFLKFK